MIPESHDDATQALLPRPTQPSKRRPRRNHLCEICCVLILLVPFLLICLLYILLYKVDLRNTVPDLESGLGGPGIGIDLTPSYATLAVHEGGVSTRVVKLIYDDDWMEMMKRKSKRKELYVTPIYIWQRYVRELLTSRSNSPWNDYCSEPWSSLGPKNIWRQIRQRLGLPSTSDVARLSDIIQQLKTAAAPHTNTTITSAVFAVPIFPQICPDELIEAARLNGMAYISTQYNTLPHELAAASIGYGFDPDYHDEDTVSNGQEYEAQPESRILAVSHTEDALVTDFHSDYALETLHRSTYSTNWTLGLRQKPTQGGPDKEYWESIAQEVESVLTTSRGVEHVDIVLLLGESTHSSSLRLFIRILLWKSQKDLPAFYDYDMTYAAAVGAAMLAEREMRKAAED